MGVPDDFADDAGSPRVSAFEGDAVLVEEPRDTVRRPTLFEPNFGMLVKLPSERDEFGQQSVYCLVESGEIHGAIPQVDPILRD